MGERLHKKGRDPGKGWLETSNPQEKGRREPQRCREMTELKTLKKYGRRNGAKKERRSRINGEEYSDYC